MQIPSKHRLLKEAPRERHPKPSSVLYSCGFPFWTLDKISGAGAVHVLPNCLAFELYKPELASTWHSGRKRFFLFRMLIWPVSMGQPYLNIWSYMNKLTYEHSIPSEWCGLIPVVITGVLQWTKLLPNWLGVCHILSFSVVSPFTICVENADIIGCNHKVLSNLENLEL